MAFGKVDAANAQSALTGAFRSPAALSPDWDRWRALPLAAFTPVAGMTRSVTSVPVPAVPAIDVHNHLGRWLTDGGGWMTPDVPDLLGLMDQCQIERIVNLDGRWGVELSENIDRYDRAHPGRFVTFCHLDWRALGDSDVAAGAAALVTQVDDAAARGARGIKIWKDLGLAVRDGSGALVLPDDERVVAACARASEHAMVVLIHTADPLAFFQPLDERNERLDELAAVPDWWFGDESRYPRFERLLAALEGLVAAAPATAFIGAHVGGYAENLSWVARMMRCHKNFHVDIGGRLGELGRQPRAFATLVADHPDRVLFGSDFFPAWAEGYRSIFRFLESADEHWPYDGEDSVGLVPSQGRWAISSAALPPEHLAAIYRGNALRLGL